MALQKKTRKRQELVMDSNYRYKYNPHWHYRHNIPMTLQEIAYIVQSYRRGWANDLGIEIGRTSGALMMVMSDIRKKGLWETYRNMDTSSFIEQLEKEEAAFYERTGFEHPSH